MPIFKKIETPENHIDFSFQNKARWFTWSEEFIEFFPAISKSSEQYGAPQLKHYKKFKMYNYTYTVALEKLDASFLKDMLLFTKCLAGFRAGQGLNFFDHLINKKMEPDAFHFLIALFRAQLAELNKDDMSSLYAPLTVTKKEDDFPLHCDLYIPQHLWNIYEEVAPGTQGTSTFLKMKKFLHKIVPGVTALPIAKRHKLEKLIKVENFKDRYEDLFLILYDETNPWADELKEKMHHECLRIKFGKGQGYMINDRKWLHGRDRTFGNVSSKRLHRLIFN